MPFYKTKIQTPDATGVVSEPSEMQEARALRCAGYDYWDAKLVASVIAGLTRNPLK